MDERFLRESRERLALALETLVGGIAHEVNNPLAAALGNVMIVLEDLRELAETLRRKEGEGHGVDPGRIDEDVDALDGARESIQRIARIVKDLTTMARPGGGPRTAARLADVVDRSLRRLPGMVGARAELRVEKGEAPDILAAADQLEQVVAHLITNGAMAIPEGRRGAVVVRVGSTPGGRALVEIRDDGAGMEPEVLARVFDPFFTTRAVGTGMGLGLPVAEAIVTAHGGTLTASSIPGQGSTFRMELPPLTGGVSPG